MSGPAGSGAPRYADLICIGSQKAATTWLHRMLAGHPGIFMPPLKEAHYFDTLHVAFQKNFQMRRSGRARRLLHEQFERTPVHRAATVFLTEILRHPSARRYVAELRFTAVLWERTLDDSWYASLFAGAGPGQVTCDFTPAYALLPPSGIEHVRRLAPDARILFILRDPVERALSHARMLVVRHGAPRTTESLRGFLDSFPVRSRDDSVAVLDRWRAHWPAELFKVLFYDDVAARPLDVLADVCRFAGLPYDPRHFPRAGKVVYRGPAIPASEEIVAMLGERFAPMLAELARRYPTPAAGWARRYGVAPDAPALAAPADPLPAEPVSTEQIPAKPTPARARG